MDINQLGHQPAGGHIGVVANCLSRTSLQNLNVSQSPLNCKISPFSVISNTSPHFLLSSNSQTFRKHLMTTETNSPIFIWNETSAR